MATATRSLMMDYDMINDIIKLGGEGIRKCYQCGTCTAICPLSEEYGIIPPRRMIKYVQLGLKDKIVSSIAPWLCFQCGDCSESCPKEADPSELMMVLRRYTIQKYSWGGVASIFYSKIKSIFTITILSILLAVLMFMFHGNMTIKYVDIYSFISYDAIHYAGLAIGVFVVLSALANMSIMYLSIKRGVKSPETNGNWGSSLITAFFSDTLFQVKYLKCGGNTNRYIAHLSLFWGFTGLFLTTILGHFIPDILGIETKTTLSMGFWIYPRIAGIVFGILILFGTSYFIYKRIEGKETFVKYSRFTDWMFLILMFVVGLTGFITTLFLQLNMAIPTYIAYALHLIFVFDLLVIAPFTKFAHAIYRPLAIVIYKVYGGV